MVLYDRHPGTTQKLRVNLLAGDRAKGRKSRVAIRHVAWKPTQTMWPHQFFSTSRLTDFSGWQRWITGGRGLWRCLGTSFLRISHRNSTSSGSLGVL